MLALIPVLFGIALFSAPNLPVVFQDPVETGPTDPPQKIERLEAWPELERKLRSRLKIEIDKLRKAATPGMESSAREALAELGAKAAPRLLLALAGERKQEARERFASVLEELTDARHTRLLAEFFDNKSLELRVFCLRRVAGFPDPGVRAAAEKAWKRICALDEKDRADERELYGAALAATSSGSIQALDAVLERAKSNWRKEAKTIRAACEGARSESATEKLLKRLKGTKQERLAALRMLSGCGTKTALPELKLLLNSSNQPVRMATIDALRGIVDGAPPLGKTSVFDTIREIDAWKERI
jgi:HEAT repeat protein